MVHQPLRRMAVPGAGRGGNCVGCLSVRLPSGWWLMDARQQQQPLGAAGGGAASEATAPWKSDSRAKLAILDECRTRRA